MNLSSLYMRESDQSHKILRASNCFNRTSYLLMRANNIAHQDLQNEYEKLIKLNQRQSSVKFNENDYESEDVFSHLTIPLYENSLQQNDLKRDHGNSTEFRRPSRKLFKIEPSNDKVNNNLLESQKPMNLNETCVLSKADEHKLPLPVVTPGLMKTKPTTMIKPFTLSQLNKENANAFNRG